MAKIGSNTAEKQGKKKMPKGKPFQGNNPETGEKDPRINRNGRPKSFDQLRSLFQDIASQEIVIQGTKYTRAQAIGIAMSMDKKLMREFLEFAYGKVPQAVDVTSKGEQIKGYAVVSPDDWGKKE